MMDGLRKLVPVDTHAPAKIGDLERNEVKESGLAKIHDRFSGSGGSGRSG